MKKFDMREWVCSLEEIIDNKLRKWKKEGRMENGEVVQLRWQWEQSHMHLDIFWEDHKEMVSLQFISPRVSHFYRWSSLDNKTFNRIQDRVGNLAQAAMHPPIDPSVNE